MAIFFFNARQRSSEYLSLAEGPIAITLSGSFAHELYWRIRQGEAHHERLQGWQCFQVSNMLLPSRAIVHHDLDDIWGRGISLGHRTDGSLRVRDCRNQVRELFSDCHRVSLSRMCCAAV